MSKEPEGPTSKTKIGFLHARHLCQAITCDAAQPRSPVVSCNSCTQKLGQYYLHCFGLFHQACPRQLNRKCHQGHTCKIRPWLCSRIFSHLWKTWPNNESKFTRTCCQPLFHGTPGDIVPICGRGHLGCTRQASTLAESKPQSRREYSHQSLEKRVKTKLWLHGPERSPRWRR